MEDKAVQQKIVDMLYTQYIEKGFLSEDTVFDALITNNLSLAQIDSVCGTLLVKGAIISSEIFEPNEDDYYDRSQLNYDKIFDEVILIEETLAPFINEVRQIKPPQNREWKNLIIPAKHGNNFARQRIIEMYLRVAIRQALLYYKKYGLHLSEAIQDGCAGLVNAYEKYEVDRPDNFTNYAPLWIRQYIMRESQPSDSLIYIPVHYRENLFYVYEIYMAHSCVSCEGNTICPILLKKITAKLTCSLEDATTFINYLIPIESIDVLLEKDELQFSDQGMFENELVETIFAYQCKLRIESFLKELKPKEKKVMELRFGLTTGEEMTLDEVGKIFKLTRERIRQIEAKSIEKLQYSTLEKYRAFL